MFFKQKILICDDHSLFCSGISELLVKQGYHVTEVFNSEKCIEALKQNQFDIFLCDLNIDFKTGFDIFEEMKSTLTKSTSFILTSYYEEFLAEKAKKLGFQGFITKNALTDDILQALQLKKGSPFFSTLKVSSKNTTIENLTEFPINKLRLSKQEKEIIKWIVKGKTSKEIGEKLFISKMTVDTHRRNINRKLEIRTVGSLIQFAHANNIID
jgi:DNA-binding NarL/FixJ family response regulator